MQRHPCRARLSVTGGYPGVVEALRQRRTLATVEFSWNPVESRANKKKHGVSFEEAQEVFTSGVEYLELFDEAHSIEEDRFLVIGPIRRGLVLVVWTERDENITRIISARWATQREADLFLVRVDRER